MELKRKIENFEYIENCQESVQMCFHTCRIEIVWFSVIFPKKKNVNKKYAFQKMFTLFCICIPKCSSFC